MYIDQSKAPVLDALLSYRAKNTAYFCIPGHRKEKGIDPEFLSAAGSDVFSLDLTETPLTDDLHAPEGCIKEAEELAAELFGSGKTYFLVNGSTCGNEAMLLTAAGDGEKVCIARNCHKSALMGLILSGSSPLYITPDYVESFNIQGGIRPDQAEEIFKTNPSCKALMVVSPTYYGIYSDIEGLAKVCHRHGALLLVDEAHGALSSIAGNLPKGAMECGADMCVQSIHKTAGSLGQSSMLHVSKELSKNKEFISRLEANLKTVQSTSPSYILMASLDAARRDLAKNADAMAENALALSNKARNAIHDIPGFRCMGKEILQKDPKSIPSSGHFGAFDIDPTRLVINAENLGISGFELKEILFEKYSVDVEMADDSNILALVSYANNEEDIDRLTAALQEISEKATSCPDAKKPHSPKAPHLHLSQQVLTPRQAHFAQKKRIPWKECVGKISAEMIAPYPPGIPVICPGERISNEIWNYVESVRIRKGHMHGPSDPELSTILITE